jgi:hypothetical protein
MKRVMELSCLAAAFVTFGLGTACTDPQSPKPEANLLPMGGTMTVTNSTTGSSIGPGYEVWVDDAFSQSPPANGVSNFFGLANGDHKVSLIMMPANCLVTVTVNGVDDGDNPRDVPIGATGTASTTYNVACASVGSLVVSTNTTGVDLGTAGYTVAVDGANQPVATNGSVTYTGLAIGSHSVALSGAAANCTLTSANPQSGTVTAGAMTSVTFAVSCAPIGSGSGSLTVTTSTTGSNLSSTGANLDAAGYTVTIDGTTSQPIATSGSVTFTAPAGGNPVALSGMAANCTVSGANPQTVTVTAGGAATTTFAVTCSPQPAPPEVRGHVQLGWGAATPGNSVQTFDFDVRADGTGRLTGTDWGDIHPSGLPASITTDPVADPATSFTAYRNASPSKCQDASRGVEFDGVGREPEGDLRSYTVQVCDDDLRRPAGNVVDFFSFYIPLGGYGRSGILTAGDIVKR